MSLDALDVALQIIRLLRPLVERIRSFDPDLARQIRKAGTSIVLNGHEAGPRIGGDARQLYRYARGSAHEATGGLLAAIGWGYVTEAECAEVLALLDRERAMLWRLGGR